MRNAKVGFINAKKGQPKPWRVRWLSSDDKYQTKFFATEQQAQHHADVVNTRNHGLPNGVYDQQNGITHKQINNLIHHYVLNNKGESFDQFYIRAKRSYSIGSIFSCGGLDMFYAPNDGGNVVLGLEKIKDRSAFFLKVHNNAKMINGELSKQRNSFENAYIKQAKKIGIDLLIATPPCQGVSKQAHQRNESLNDLIIPTLRIFNALLPQNLLIENIPQYPKQKIKYAGRLVTIENFIKSKVPNEYSIRFTQLDAQDYSTPQRRHTWFALISRKGMWPDPVKHEKSVSVLEAIGNKAMFPAIKNGQKSKVPLHEAPQTSSHIIDRITELQPAQSLNTHRKTSYMRENKNSPAFKQTTNYNASGTSNLHYEEDRVKSLRERFALSGLPAHLCDFLDTGSQNSFKQRYGYSRQFFADITGEILAPKLLLAVLQTMPV